MTDAAGGYGGTALGVDLGSRRVKIALVRDGRIAGWRAYNTPSFYRHHSFPAGETDEGGEFPPKGTGTPGGGPTRVIRIDFESLGFPAFARTACTGYGREALSVDGARVVSEVLAHAAGAGAQTGLSTFLNLDMGGQDFKLSLVEDGTVSDMAANPRCAASSGRFLETMAEVLEMGVDEMGSYRDDPLDIDSTCSVFAETEVVGLLSQGYPVERIAAGVNRALVRKVAPFARRFLDRAGAVVFTGGCARGPALVDMLEEELERRVLVPANPDANGALGCTLVG